MSALLPALQIVLPAAAVGFGVGAIATAATRPRVRPRGGEPTCVTGAWSRPAAPSSALAHELGPAARETLAQFPAWSLTPAAQAQAFEAAAQYLDAVQDLDVEGETVLALPGVPGSPVPEPLEISVRTQLERVQVLSRFAGAVAAAAVAPDCEFSPPLSDAPLDDERAQAVQQAIEQVAIVALAERDGRPIPVDVDPAATVMEEEDEVCMPEGVVLPLRSPTILAPQIGDDPDDSSWPISHEAQVQAYEALLQALADPEQTAPISVVVQALAPECPWAQKARYGLDMTTLWYATQRMARIASADLASWGSNP